MTRIDDRSQVLPVLLGLTLGAGLIWLGNRLRVTT